MPRFGEPFIVQSDYSQDGVAAVLMQEVDGVRTPVMFASRCLVPAEANYSPTEGEALAILFALRRFEYLLQGQKVVIQTDHRPLEFIRSGSENNKKLARWWSELQGFDYRVEYVPGRSNISDCLSRLTTRKEEPKPCETLGCHQIALAVITGAEDRSIRCTECRQLGDDDLLRCDLCGAIRHLHCWEGERRSGLPPTLPFWYCGGCVRKLSR